MTTIELLSDLRSQGFTLTPESGTLHVAPASRLTPEQIALIRAQKPALLVALTSRQTNPTAPVLEQVKAVPRLSSGEAAGKLNTLEETARLIQRSKVLAFDVETTGLNPRRDRVRLLSLANGKESVVLDCFAHDPKPLLHMLARKSLVAHNAVFDLGFLWGLGLTEPPETVCTYLLSQLLRAGVDVQRGFGRCSLAACCYDHLQMELPKDLQKSDWSGSLTADQVTYSRRDSEILVPLLQAMNQKLNEAGLHHAADLEMRALRAFVWMSMSGVPFDAEAWKALADKAAAEKTRLETELDQLAPPKGAPGLFGAVEHWNWASPVQVADILCRLGFDVATTNDAQLALLDHPLAVTLRQHRHVAQLVKMYGVNWLAKAELVSGRLFPGWRQIGTVTGRTSGEEPNCQQIPRDEDPETKRVIYRTCFKAPPGRVLIKADYATLQMRIAARIAGDRRLVEIFQGGLDPHTATAQMTLNKKEITKADRQIAKSQNFGLLFGLSADGLRIYANTTYGVLFSPEEALKHRNAFFRAYPGLAAWHDRVRKAKSNETRSRFGRRRLLHSHTPDTERLNSPVQADESDLTKTAMALLWERRAEVSTARPVIFCHDEIVVEADEGEATAAEKWLTKAMMDAAQPILEPVPAAVESKILPTWGG